MDRLSLQFQQKAARIYVAFNQPMCGDTHRRPVFALTQNTNGDSLASLGTGPSVSSSPDSKTTLM
jgi:hypothetical protein